MRVIIVGRDAFLYFRSHRIPYQSRKALAVALNAMHSLDFDGLCDDVAHLDHVLNENFKGFIKTYTARNICLYISASLDFVWILEASSFNTFDDDNDPDGGGGGGIALYRGYLLYVFATACLSMLRPFCASYARPKRLRSCDLP